MCVECARVEDLVPMAARFPFWSYRDSVWEALRKGDPIHPDIIRSGTRSMTSALESALDISWDDLDPSDARFARMGSYELNLLAHNAFKNHYFFQEMSLALQKLKGKDARKLFDQVYDTFYKHYHAAETNFAAQVAFAKEQWQDIQESAGIFDRLTYNTVGDDRVRPEHAALDGVTLPVDHPFWKTWFPPNGYNCRCFVTQDFEGALKEPPGSLPAIEEQFALNWGTDLPQARLFTDQMPYFKRQKGLPELDFSHAEARQINRMMNLLSADLKGYVDITPEGVPGTILAHVFRNPANTAREVEQAARFIKKGQTVKLLPEINEQVSGRMSAYKSPDGILSGKLIEYKDQTGTSLSRFLDNRFREANAQGAEILALSLKQWDINLVYRFLTGKWPGDNNINEIWVRIEDKNYVIRSRSWKEDIKAINVKSP